jgi:hypothetical protein
MNPEIAQQPNNVAAPSTLSASSLFSTHFSSTPYNGNNTAPPAYNSRPTSDNLEGNADHVALLVSDVASPRAGSAHSTNNNDVLIDSADIVEKKQKATVTKLSTVSASDDFFDSWGGDEQINASAPVDTTDPSVDAHRKNSNITELKKEQPIDHGQVLHSSADANDVAMVSPKEATSKENAWDDDFDVTDAHDDETHPPTSIEEATTETAQNEAPTEPQEAVDAVDGMNAWDDDLDIADSTSEVVEEAQLSPSQEEPTQNQEPQHAPNLETDLDSKSQEAADAGGGVNAWDDDMEIADSTSEVVEEAQLSPSLEESTRNQEPQRVSDMETALDSTTAATDPWGKHNLNIDTAEDNYSPNEKIVGEQGTSLQTTDKAGTEYEQELMSQSEAIVSENDEQEVDPLAADDFETTDANEGHLEEAEKQTTEQTDTDVQLMDKPLQEKPEQSVIEEVDSSDLDDVGSVESHHSDGGKTLDIINELNSAKSAQVDSAQVEGGTETSNIESEKNVEYDAVNPWEEGEIDIAASNSNDFVNENTSNAETSDHKEQNTNAELVESTSHINKTAEDEAAVIWAHDDIETTASDSNEVVSNHDTSTTDSNNVQLESDVNSFPSQLGFLETEENKDTDITSAGLEHSLKEGEEDQPADEDVYNSELQEIDHHIDGTDQQPKPTLSQAPSEEHACSKQDNTADDIELSTSTEQIATKSTFFDHAPDITAATQSLQSAFESHTSNLFDTSKSTSMFPWSFQNVPSSNADNDQTPENGDTTETPSRANDKPMVEPLIVEESKYDENEMNENPMDDLYNDDALDDMYDDDDSEEDEANHHVNVERASVKVEQAEEVANSDSQASPETVPQHAVDKFVKQLERMTESHQLEMDELEKTYKLKLAQLQKELQDERTEKKQNKAREAVAAQDKHLAQMRELEKTFNKTLEEKEEALLQVMQKNEGITLKMDSMRREVDGLLKLVDER